MLKQKIREISSITVEDFFSRHEEALQLKLVGKEDGFKRKIGEPAPNRPGLALSGFLTYFAPKRVQVFGNSEVTYLLKLDPEVRKKRVEALCKQKIPCLVIARNRRVPEDVLDVMAENGVPIFKTPILTMKCLNQIWVC